MPRLRLLGERLTANDDIICIDCYPTCKDERALCGAEIENHDHLAEGVGDECVVCAYLWESHWCCTEEKS